MNKELETQPIEHQKGQKDDQHLRQQQTIVAQGG